jgi:phosphohistidine phosphatase
MTEPRRTLAVLRHAKSAWPDGVPDFERPLNGRGRRDATAAGHWLREHLPGLALVFCSPATRARQTWELAAAELSGEPEVRHDEQLYDASIHDLVEVARSAPDDAHTLLVVAHNPGIETFAAYLGGVGEAFKTSSLEVITGTGSWTGLGRGWGASAGFATLRG